MRTEGIDLEYGGRPLLDVKFADDEVCGRHFGPCYIMATGNTLA